MTHTLRTRLVRAGYYQLLDGSHVVGEIEHDGRGWLVSCRGQQFWRLTLVDALAYAQGIVPVPS